MTFQDQNNAIGAVVCFGFGLVFMALHSVGAIWMFALAAVNVWLIGRAP